MPWITRVLGWTDIVRARVGNFQLNAIMNYFQKVYKFQGPRR